VKKSQQLIPTYNVRGPSYTPHPTVPFWKDEDLKIGRLATNARLQTAGVFQLN
jgi:hypothetical protein